MEVRRAKKEDVAGVLHLLRQVNLVHHEGRPDLFKIGTKYSEEELLRIFAEDSTPVFIAADEQGTVLGHAFGIFEQLPDDAIRTDVRTLYIDDICVDEHHRREGVGEALYQRMLTFAKENGCYNVTLNVWALNEGATRFYERMGMRVQKTGMEVIL